MTSPGKPLRLGVNLRPLLPGKIGGMENYARNIIHQLAQRDVSDIASICAFTSRRNHDILRLDQVEQMALCRENVSVARTHGGADVFRLAGFLCDDNLISHKRLVRKNRLDSGDENI